MLTQLIPAFSSVIAVITLIPVQQEQVCLVDAIIGRIPVGNVGGPVLAADVSKLEAWFKHHRA